MHNYQSHEVFIAGGMPTLTYISRKSYAFEKNIQKYQKVSYKFIAVTGPTKCGKTVLVNKYFPRNQCLWFDSGTYNDEESFWIDICDQLKTYTTKSFENSSSKSIGGEIEAEAKIWIFNVFVKIKNKIKSTFTKTNKKTYSITMPSKNLAISGLKDNNIPLIIDDFHYINQSEQKNILRALKPLVFIGKPIILISIPHRKYDVLKAERELIGRYEPIEVLPWNEEELAKIPLTGFPLLNVEVASKDIEYLSNESLGSPHLMQELCLELCNLNDINTTSKKKIKIKIKDEIDEICKKVAENTGRPVYDKLKKGPRSRTDRITRKLKDGTETDIYGLMLTALGKLRPGVSTLDYESIRSSLREIVSAVPQSNEITRVLEYMSKISFDENSSTPVLDWEKEDGLLHITDPFFSFYLRWGNTSLK